MIKRILCCLLAILMLFSLSACKAGKKDADSNRISNQDLNYVNKAIDVINTEWESVYSKINKSVHTDNMIEITNARIIHIKNNNSDYFKDVDVVVEFDLFTDYYGGAPYYFNVQQNDTVVFYKDGSNQVNDIFKNYLLKTGENDYSDIIEYRVECGDTFRLGNIKTAKVTGSNEKYILDAREIISSEWSRKNRDKSDDTAKDETSNISLNIINTRLLLINDQSNYTEFEKYFDDIEAIVEFELYQGETNNNSYYPNNEAANTVIFYKNGNTEVTSNYIRKISTLTFDYNFSDLFTDIFECGSLYNRSFTPF